MKQYPDPEKFLEQHLEQAAEKRIRGMKQAGLTTISWKLFQRLIERDIEEGKQRYIEDGEKILEHNTKVYMKNYRRRNNLRLWICPPIAVLFGLMAWSSFTHSGGLTVAAIYTFGSLAFLTLLVLGALFDRPMW